MTIDSDMTAEQASVKREFSWLELEEISISFASNSGWRVSPGTISRKILIQSKIVIPPEDIQIAPDSLIKLNDEEPVGILKIYVSIDPSMEPIMKEISVTSV